MSRPPLSWVSSYKATRSRSLLFRWRAVGRGSARAAARRGAGIPDEILARKTKCEFSLFSDLDRFGLRVDLWRP